MQKKYNVNIKSQLRKSESYEKASEWLDSHSTANLESIQVQFEVASPLKVKILDSLNEIEETIVIHKKVSQKIQQIARKEGISTRTLIHRWLKEKVEQSQL